MLRSWLSQTHNVKPSIIAGSRSQDYRLDAYISPDAHAALQQVVQRDGISRKDAIERSILNGSERTQHENAIPHRRPCYRPRRRRNDSKPALAAIRLTAKELAPRKPVPQPATHERIHP